MTTENDVSNSIKEEEGDSSASFLSDTQEEGVQYVKPNYIETELSKDKRQECRDIVRVINEYGVSQRQKLFIIYLLALELENRELLLSITRGVGAVQDKVGKSRILSADGTTSAAAANPKKKIISTT